MFNESKYTKWYLLIINTAKTQNRQKHSRYLEDHHILPKCMGGSDDKDNMVLLTLREHFICHLLLPHMVYNKNYKTRLLFALSYFKKCFTSSMYERYRIKHSESMSLMIWINDGNISKRIHPEEMDLFLDWNIGRLYHPRTKKMSQESKDRISKANTGRLVGDKNHAARTIIYQESTYSTLTEAMEKTGLSKYLLKKNGAIFI